MGQKGSKLTRQATEVAESLATSLASLGEVTSRKMFGGYGIFASGMMFALVNSEGIAHLKVDDSNRAVFEKAGAQKYGRMPYYAIPESVLTEPSRLRDWASSSIAAAQAAK